MSKLAIKERIINILNYKKPGFWGLLAAVIICIVSIVCFLTTPSQPTESENAGETEFSGTEEIIAHYEDYDELLKALANDFSSRSGNSKLFYVCPGDDTPSLTTLNKVSDIQLFFYTLEENMNYTIGKSSLTLMRTYKGYDVYKQENTIMDKITSAEDYIGYPNLYFYTDLLAVAESNHPEANATEQPLRDLIIGYYCNDGRYTELDDSFALFAPDTALKALLPLSDGTLEVFPGKDDLHKLVCYTFADGSQLTFVMETDGPASSIGGSSFWFPQSGGVYTTSHAAMEAQKTEAFTLHATAEDLKHAKEGFSDATDYLYTLPDAFSPDLFCKVAETSDSSVILYGLRNCNSLILQDGDNIYPIFMRWYLNRGILPEIYKNDYDGDGDAEYAIYSLESSGSEAQIMRLTILEVIDGSLVMEIFDNARLYEYINVIDDLGNKFACGSFIYFEERDGQWWVRTSAIPDLGQSITLEAPLTYYDHHMYSNRYFDIGEVSVVDTLDNDLYSQLDAFPGECSVDAAGNLVTTISVIDYECAMTASSYTGETVYHWSSPEQHRLSPKIYPLEIRDGNVQEVPAKVVTEDEISKYTFGRNLIAQAYQAFPSGIKQYILRENGTIHVNIGYEADDFLNLQYMTFQISEDRQTVTLSDYGMGYYLLYVNDVAGLNAFRDTFTGKNHFLPSDTTHLPWEWLITMNDEKYYKPQLKVEDTPVILHDYDFETLPHYNLNDFYHGFYASEIRANGTYYIKFHYQEGSDDITILTDNSRKVVALTINGVEKELPAQPLHIYHGIGGSHSVPYYIDVTDDGKKELIFCEGYRNDGDSYVYFPTSMEQLTFDKNIEELASKIFIEYQKVDTEENKLYCKVHYEDQVVEDKTYCNFDREDFVKLLDDGDILTAAAEYFSYTPQKEASYIYFDQTKNCFVTRICLYIDNTYESIFGYLYADYIWDNAANQFVIDMDTVTLSLY